MDIPMSIMSRYQKVIIADDIMFVNKLPFFVSISRHIKLSTSEFLSNQKTVTLVNAIKRIQQTYATSSFQITTCLMDGQFNKDGFEGELAVLGITLNIVAAEEDVHEMERHIRTIKERARSVITMLPFDQYPSRMIIELIAYCVFCFNSFTAVGGVSDVLSPRSIVLGTSINYANHCPLEYGTNVQTHEPHDNTMLPRTTGAFALRRTGNDQVGHYFFCLTSGRRLNCNHWTELPMPADVVQRINRLSRCALNLPAMEFSNCAGVPFPDHDIPDNDTHHDHNDSTYNPDDADDPDLNHDTPDVSIAGVSDDDDDVDDDVIDDEIEPLNNVEVTFDDDLNIVDNVNHAEAELELEQDAVIEGVEAEGILELEPGNEEIFVEEAIVEGVEEEGIPDEEEEIPTEIDVAARMDATYGPRKGQYDLRARKPRDFGHMHTTLESTVMTQYNVQKGLQMFGDAGVEAVMKELTQLHKRGVMEPKKWDEMTDEERDASLQYLMFLKEKRNGIIKGRGCADGRKQRVYTTKEESTSPTVAIKSVMLSCAIDEKEGRDVATVDIPGAFMQANQDDLVYMKLVKWLNLWFKLTLECIDNTYKLRKERRYYMLNSRKHSTER